MPQVTIVYGVLLIVLGLYGFFASGMESLTALIPSGFGFVFALLGAISAANHKIRKHIMHVAVVIALVAAGATGKAVPTAYAAMGGQAVDRPLAVYSQAIMCGLSSAYFLACLGSFFAARRRASAAKAALATK